MFRSYVLPSGPFCNLQNLRKTQDLQNLRKTQDNLNFWHPFVRKHGGKRQHLTTNLDIGILENNARKSISAFWDLDFWFQTWATGSRFVFFDESEFQVNIKQLLQPGGKLYWKKLLGKHVFQNSCLVITRNPASRFGHPLDTMKV